MPFYNKTKVLLKLPAIEHILEPLIGRGARQKNGRVDDDDLISNDMTVDGLLVSSFVPERFPRLTSMQIFILLKRIVGPLVVALSSKARAHRPLLLVKAKTERREVEF